ncbi:MAG: MG2 domain-containing protein, partial [Myxococcaceae bacterium]
MRRLALSAVLLVSSFATAQEDLPDDPWPEVVAAIKDQRYTEATAAVELRLKQAKAKKDVPNWTRALVRRADLQLAMSQWREAAVALKAESWPDDPTSRVVLDVAYANALLGYASSEGYELRQREPLGGKRSDDLSKWTFDEVTAEAFSVLNDAFSLRSKLGELKAIASYVRPNDFPNGIRSTARDALSYLYAEALGDTQYWSAAQSNGLELLSTDELLASPKDPAAVLADPAAHPLLKQAAVYSDLQSFHSNAGRSEAAFEARRTWLLSLHSHLQNEDDQARIVAALQDAMKSIAGKPWWAMGEATVAQLLYESDPVSARDHAAAGAKAFPDSVGGKKCGYLKAILEQPILMLKTMSSDGAKKRSVLLTHRNVEKVYFKAYRLDFDARLHRPNENLFPEGEALRKIVKDQRPVAHWSEQLPPTPDLRPHQTFVTLPSVEPGEYAILASTSEDLQAKGSLNFGVSMLISDLVVLTSEAGKNVEVTALSGETGQPVPGVSVQLLRHDWDPARYATVAAVTTDKNGKLVLKHPRGESELVLVASHGADRGFMAMPYRGEDEEEKPPAVSSFIYTDRSVYRPNQRVLWKVVAYRPSRVGQSGLVVAPNASFTVTLHDANDEEVASKKVKSNEFGTASGEFTIPPGRLLGGWTLQTSIEGESSIRVEEYKRPTFEVALSEPKEALRLNRPTIIPGNARYYFGLPVNKGQVRYRVVRIPRFPPWWGWFAREGVNEQRQQIGSGVAAVKPDGTFELPFTPKADERKAKVPGVSYEYQVSVDVLDEVGESRSAERTCWLGFVTVEADVSQE